MEYKIEQAETGEARTTVVHVDVGGWVKKSSKNWKFVTAHSYKIISSPKVTVDEFLVRLLSPKVSATGRSDACGRGPGIVLGVEQSNILDTEDGCRQLLRLFFIENLSSVVSSNKKLPPYTEMNLCPRCDSRLLVDMLTDNPMIIRGFLDAESPDVSVKSTSCCVVS
jgi:hypothetical protein